MTIQETTYSCNMCGKEMKHKTPKLVMGEWDGDSFEKLDIHICQDCRPEVISFANHEPPMLLTSTFTREEKAKAGMTVSHTPKKHEFYGNQYILPNRKSRK